MNNCVVLYVIVIWASMLITLIRIFTLILNQPMVNGSRYYRALESVSIASASSTTLTIYPCQIWVH